MTEERREVVIGFTYNYNEGFGGDRPAKNDLTASTLTFLFKNNKNVSFWEKDINGNLVPYGDPRAYEQDRYDLYIKYYDFWFAVEMKSRDLSHISYWVTAATEGEMFEIEKCEETKELQQEGYICLWAAVYNDGRIRIWQLNYMDLDKLPMKPKTKPKYNVKSSPFITEDVYLLPPQQSIIIDRINGN